MPKYSRCTFEDGMCDWHNVVDMDDFDWRIHNGSSPTLGTGPNVDHTIGTKEGKNEPTQALLSRSKYKRVLTVCLFTSNSHRFAEFW